MKAKELVEKCNKQKTCDRDCKYRVTCFCYKMEFNCFPFEASRGCNGSNSDTEIYIPENIGDYIPEDVI